MQHSLHCIQPFFIILTDGAITSFIGPSLHQSSLHVPGSGSGPGEGTRFGYGLNFGPGTQTNLWGPSTHRQETINLLYHFVPFKSLGSVRFSRNVRKMNAN